MCATHLLVTIAMLAVSFSTPVYSAEISRELLQDPHFRQGFTLLSPTMGKRDPIATLQSNPTGPAPVWEIAQWSSRFAAISTEDGSSRWSNKGKIVELNKLGADSGDLTLAVNGSAEYGPYVRKRSDPWVHLLVEQHLAGSPPIEALLRLNIKIEYRLNYCRLNAEQLYDPSIHAAQFVLFLHISNRDQGSSQFGRYLHFGIPLYDNRHQSPPAHVAPDTGGTGMHIYMPALKEFTEKPVPIGKWVAVEKDVLPLIRRGLQDAFEKGHFGESRDLKSYFITFFTLGWELPGNFDVSLDVRNLSVCAVTGP